MQSFTQFCEQLALTFGKRDKQDTQTHLMTIGISHKTLPNAPREPMSHNSRKCQNKIDTQTSEITDMLTELNKTEEENETLCWAFDLLSIAQVIHKAATSLQAKPNKSSSGVAKSSSYTGKPYNGELRPSQLSPDTDHTLDPDVACHFCKDTDHR